MKKILTLALVVCMAFMPCLRSSAQKPAPSAADKPSVADKPSAADKLESIFKGAEIPYVKLAADHFKVAVTLENNESAQFQVFLQTLGDDPNDPDLQLMQVVFLLGELPKGTTPPAALFKKINDWNNRLSRGSVVMDEGVIIYQSSAWIAKTDAQSLLNDASLGHYSSQTIRKELAPYLKQ